MRIYVAIEQHFLDYEGRIYTDIAFPYEYWQEYLAVFEEVCPIARVRPVTSLPSQMRLADGPQVRFVRVRDYQGFWDFLWRAPLVLYDCWRGTAHAGCFLLRMGNIATCCWLSLMLRRKSYAYEVVGHAGESIELLRNLRRFGINRLIASLNHRLTAVQVRKAHCAAYVSRYVKRLYPPGKKAGSWIFSGVRLGEGVITGPRSVESLAERPLRIVSVGRLEPEKGHSILIEALGGLKKRGISSSTRIVGPGQEIPALARRCADLCIADDVEFCGPVAWGGELFAHLDWAQLFVLPSLTEGMPRALIEGMARGLPAVGSDTGGITELLDKSLLVPPGDAEALERRIAELAADPEMMAKASRDDFSRAMDYRAEVMTSRKHAFWNCLKSAVEENDICSR